MYIKYISHTAKFKMSIREKLKFIFMPIKVFDKLLARHTYTCARAHTNTHAHAHTYTYTQRNDKGHGPDEIISTTTSLFRSIIHSLVLESIGACFALPH